METGNENSHKHNVHKVLAHSYSMYFVLFLIGISLDLAFGTEIFSNSIMVSVGAVVLVLATFLIFWAQNSSRKLHKEEIHKKSFHRGPYKHLRHPTYLGLFLLMLGFGILVNALFIVLSTLLSFVLTKILFLDKEEQILEKKYGDHYIEYKKSVKL